MPYKMKWNAKPRVLHYSAAAHRAVMAALDLMLRKVWEPCDDHCVLNEASRSSKDNAGWTPKAQFTCIDFHKGGSVEKHLVPTGFRTMVVTYDRVQRYLLTGKMTLAEADAELSKFIGTKFQTRRRREPVFNKKSKVRRGHDKHLVNGKWVVRGGNRRTMPKHVHKRSSLFARLQRKHREYQAGVVAA